MLIRSNSRWLVEGFESRLISPPVPAGYEQVSVRVREYDIEAGNGLPRRPQSVAFSIRNDGDLEHDIALLWLDERVPTEGFFFGVAYWSPPFIEFYGGVRIAPGKTARLIPRQQLQHREGRYVLFCTVGERGPSHARLGMLLELEAR